MSAETSRDGVPVRLIGEVVGLFAVVGLGMGIIATLVLGQFTGGGSGIGSALIAGIGYLTALTVAGLTAPIVATVTGLRTGRQLGRGSSGYLTSVVGAAIGAVVLMSLVVLCLSIGLSGGGGGAETTAGSTTGQSTGSGDLGQLLVIILSVALPTGVVGAAGTYFGSTDAQETGSRVGNKGDGIPLRTIGIVAAAVVVLTVVGFGASAVLGGGGANAVEVVGEPTFTQEGSDLSSSITLNNTGSDPVSANVTARLVINGEADPDFSRTSNMSLDGHEQRNLIIGFADTSAATRSQEQALNNGNYLFQVLVEDDIAYELDP